MCEEKNVVNGKNYNFNLDDFEIIIPNKKSNSKTENSKSKRLTEIFNNGNFVNLIGFLENLKIKELGETKNSRAYTNEERFNRNFLLKELIGKIVINVNSKELGIVFNSGYDVTKTVLHYSVFILPDTLPKTVFHTTWSNKNIEIYKEQSLFLYRYLNARNLEESYAGK